MQTFPSYNLKLQKAFKSIGLSLTQVFVLILKLKDDMNFFLKRAVYPQTLNLAKSSTNIFYKYILFPILFS